MFFCLPVPRNTPSVVPLHTPAAISIDGNPTLFYSYFSALAARHLLCRYKMAAVQGFFFYCTSLVNVFSDECVRDGLSSAASWGRVLYRLVSGYLFLLQPCEIGPLSCVLSHDNLSFFPFFSFFFVVLHPTFPTLSAPSCFLFLFVFFLRCSFRAGRWLSRVSPPLGWAGLRPALLYAYAI